MQMFDGENINNKCTVNYINENRDDLVRMAKIKLQSESIGCDASTCAEDIVNDTLIYFVNTKDYDYEYKSKKTGQSISLADYIKSGLYNCIKRYKSDFINEKQMIESYDIDPEQDKSNKTDKIDLKKQLTSNEPTYMECLDSIEELHRLCKSVEFLRYKYGADLFLVVYLALLGKTKNSMLLKYLDIDLGLFQKKCKDTRDNVRLHNQCRDFLRAMAYNEKIGIEVLKNYLYDFPTVEKIIQKYSV